MVIDVSTSSLIVLQLSKLFSSVNQSHIRQATTDFYNETFFVSRMGICITVIRMKTMQCIVREEKMSDGTNG